MFSTTDMLGFYDRKCQFMWKILLLERKALQKFVIWKDFFCSCQDKQEFMSHCQNINNDRSDLMAEPKSPTIQVCAGILKQWGTAVCLSDTSFPPDICWGVVCICLFVVWGFCIFLHKIMFFSYVKQKFSLSWIVSPYVFLIQLWLWSLSLAHHCHHTGAVGAAETPRRGCSYSI